MPHRVIVLIPGYADAVEQRDDGRLRAGGTVTLVKGRPNVVVDTGAPHQRNELLARLKQNSVQPGDIAYVINTHGHLDHIGNNNLFPHATFLLDTDVAKDDMYWTHDFERDGPFLINTTTGDEPDDAPSLTVIPTPGHTDQDVSVIVETASGIVAIVGDLFEHEGDWHDEHVWQQWSRSKDLHRASRERILRLADFIVPGHGDIFRVPAEFDVSS